MKHVLAVDIGGSKLIVGVVDETGRIAAKKKHLWERLDEKSVLDTVIQSGKDMLGSFDGEISGIGITIPGLCDPAKGIWIESCFSGLVDIPIREAVSSAFGLPVAIENDVNTCALAEKMFGCCQDTTDFVWVTVSNGCGGALFLNNALYRGQAGNAGEIGHVIVEEDGFECSCGNKGCLEIQAAGPGIVRRYLQKNPVSTDIDAAEVAKRARDGEAAAQEVYRDEGVYLGRAIAAAVNLVNPQKVIIGGGVSASFDLFADTLRKTVMQRIYRSANQGLMIETTALGYYAPLIGAAALALK